MTLARVSIRPTGVILLVAVALACHQPARRTDNDRPRDRAETRNTNSAEIFSDTTIGVVHYTSARTFDLQRVGMRDTLGRILDAERKLWQAGKPSAYRVLLRVQCFCPGQPGWLLIEAREGKPLQAWDRTGRPVSLTSGFAFDIDTLYDLLRRSAARDASVQVAFDGRWHFPAYTSTTASARLPDTWSIIELRGFRPF